MKSKPDNMKYTDLCQYIDKTVYERDEHNNPIKLKNMTEDEMITVYSYIYHLVYALAVKKKMMSNYTDYTDFCMGVTGKVYQRLTGPNQKFGDDKSRGKPIKSVLNYIRTCLPFMAIDWRLNNYSQMLGPGHSSEEDSQGARDYLTNTVLQQYEANEREDVCEIFDSIDKYIDKILPNSVFGKNKSKLNDLELSVYSTLLNIFNLPYNCKDISDNRKCKYLLNQIQNKENFIIHWGDNTEITDQIILLEIKKILNKMQEDIDNTTIDNTLSDDILNEIIASSLPTYGMNQMEGD